LQCLTTRHNRHNTHGDGARTQQRRSHSAQAMRCIAPCTTPCHAMQYDMMHCNQCCRAGQRGRYGGTSVGRHGSPGKVRPGHLPSTPRHCHTHTGTHSRWRCQNGARAMFHRDWQQYGAAAERPEQPGRTSPRSARAAQQHCSCPQDALVPMPLCTNGGLLLPVRTGEGVARAGAEGNGEMDADGPFYNKTGLIIGGILNGVGVCAQRCRVEQKGGYGGGEER
jgi:hypothetical protein